ncbi:MAG: hypothetical protein WCK70_17230 [Chloroflexales bacterium]|jgi:hypothetical protein
MIRRTSMTAVVLFALTLLLSAASVKTASAQGPRCFPEVQNKCISGSIRTYWEKNGGLPIFGYPIRDQNLETVEGRTIQVQWFERDRLEIQADGTVTTGRLGVQMLEIQGRPWQQGNKMAPDSGCIANFPTGHQVCGTFARFWQKNGGLVRLGYPVTPEIQETIQGQLYTVQYFERRRFELHGDQVMLGLLGSEVRSILDTPPDPCVSPGVPTSQNAAVKPNCGPGGTVFAAVGAGFDVGENIGVYITAPDQTVFGAKFQVPSDKDGLSDVVTFTTKPGFPLGVYAISFEGVTSHHKAIAYLRVK